MIDRTEPGAGERDQAALARLRLSSIRRRIVLAADFGRDWPLWEDDQENDVLNIFASPDDYGLSDVLTLRVRKWFDFWSAHYDPNTLWDSPANQVTWHNDGRAIAESLRDEVRDFADVEFPG